MSERISDVVLNTFDQARIDGHLCHEDAEILLDYLKAERSRVAELEAIRGAGLTAVAAAHYALIKMERRAEAAEAVLRDTLTEIAEAACMPFPDLATKDEIVTSVKGRLAVLERVRGLVEKWRKSASAVINNEWDAGWNHAEANCANKLQAELDKLTPAD
jgi:hypothetical protein